jgi:hypothetical protein
MATSKLKSAMYIIVTSGAGAPVLAFGGVQ